MEQFGRQVLLAALGLGFVAVAGAWSRPAQEPPAGNVEPPINVSVSRQVKGGVIGVGGIGIFGRGFVSNNVNYDLSDRLLFGVNGSIGANEYCDETGTKCVSIDQILSLQTNVYSTSTTVNNTTGARLVCPSAPAYTSTPKGTGFGSFDIAASCATPDGCVIKHEFTREKNGALEVYNTYYTNFRQDSLSGTSSGWWSTYAPTSAAKNGDKTAAYVVQGMVKDGKDPWVVLYDDHTNAAGETSVGKLTAYDAIASYGARYWFCSYQ